MAKKSESPKKRAGEALAKMHKRRKDARAAHAKGLRNTIVKNGKRVPASEKGKGKKRPTPAAAKKLAAEVLAAQKKERKAAIARHVEKITKASKTLMGQLYHLVVEGYDEPNARQEELKGVISGLTGLIEKDKAEILKLSREAQAKGAKPTGEDAKRLSGLELDVSRRTLERSEKKDERAGCREMMKVSWQNVRDLIKDKASGQMRLDDVQEGKDESSGSTSPAPGANGASAPSLNGAGKNGKSKKRGRGTAAASEGSDLGAAIQRGLDAAGKIVDLGEEWGLTSEEVDDLKKAGIVTASDAKEALDKIEAKKADPHPAVSTAVYKRLGELVAFIVKEATGAQREESVGHATA